MPAPSAKAFRCESCGAALPEGKATCDYCGSHHNLPAWSDEMQEAAQSEPRRASQRGVRLGVAGVAVAAAAGLIWWFTR